MPRRRAPGSRPRIERLSASWNRSPAAPQSSGRLTELWNYEKFAPPIHEGGRYFFTYNTGLQNQSVLYTSASIDGEASVLIDPNTLSAGRHGRTVGHRRSATTAASSPTGSPRPARTGTCGRCATWPRARTCPTTSNGSSSRKPSGGPTTRASSTGGSPSPSRARTCKGANYDQRVYYHRLGTNQQDDVLVWEDPEHKEWRAAPTVTDDGKYLILTIEKGTDNKFRVVYRPLDQPDQKPVHLVGDFDADYTFIDNDGPVFWFRTDKDAPRGKVVAIDIRKPRRPTGSS